VKSGTPGFVGSRLREAREVRSLTAVALSEMVGVTPQAISQYESGKSSPSPEVLRGIAGTVNLPEHFFLRAEREHAHGTIFYRSMSSATKGARARAERRFSWLRDIVRYLTEFVALPEPNFPNLNLATDPLLLSDEEIEDAATEVRRYWGLRDGPISNAVLLLENQGAVIARDRLGADTLDGLSEFVAEDRRPYIMVGTDKGSPVRWRFDVAHELAHVVLHAGVDTSRFSRPEQFKRIEEQAHRFAGAFLLPAAPFGEDLFAANLDALQAIKPKWKVSIGMMITRARQLGFISEDSMKKLWINASRRGWRRVEPYDESMEAEQPRLLRRSVELVLSEGAQTPEDVQAALALPAIDVEALCGLPVGYLNTFSRVSLRDQTGPPVRGTTTPAEVIPITRRQRLV
jgi:Zn-dependent peptidase ImmA (M78 family)/DNA-binding XRE family transcriptional regulator